MEKGELRRIIGEKKRAMSAQEIDAASARLAARLTAMEQYRRAGSLFAYIAFNQEVRTVPVIRRAWADGKRVAVPKIVGREMSFFWIDSFDCLRKGPLGIPEPMEGAPAADDDSALVLVPGLAFDAAGNRVGYGGGYYDRYLAAHPLHPTAALCYGFQMLDSIESDPFDIPVNVVIADL